MKLLSVLIEHGISALNHPFSYNFIMYSDKTARNDNQFPFTVISLTNPTNP